MREASEHADGDVKDAGFVVPWPRAPARGDLPTVAHHRTRPDSREPVNTGCGSDHKGFPDAHLRFSPIQESA